MKLDEGRLRLLVVSYSLSGGGAERFTSTLMSHIDRNRFQPSLALLRDNISYPFPSDIPLWILGKRKPWHIIQAISRLRKIIMRTRPHVVLSTIAYTTRVTGESLRGSSFQPYWIARVGDNPALEASGLLQFLINIWNKFTYSRVNKCVTNSQGLARGMKSYYPFVADRVCSVYNPTDFELIDKLAQEPINISCSSELPVVLSVGRLDKQKRPDILLDSFALLRNRMQVELLICGEGPLRKQVAHDIAARGLGDSVKLLGYQENPYALMRQSALFLITSDHEGLPNALIEAQGLGLPAVSTNCPYGPDEIIEDGKTGILVQMGDPISLCNAMEELLSNPERRQDMSIAARRRARRLFDKSTQIREWEKVLEGSRTGNVPS